MESLSIKNNHINVNIFQDKRFQLVLGMIYNFLIGTGAYGLLLHTHYSVDSFSEMHNITYAPLINGRYVWYVIALLFNKIGVKPIFLQTPFTLIFILVISYSIAKFSQIVCISRNIVYPIDFFLINSIFSVGFINPCMGEWFLFPEIVLYYAIGLFLMTESVIAVLHYKYILSFICVLGASLCYQILLPMFLIYSLSLIVLTLPKSKTFHLIFKVFLIAFICGIIAVFSQHIINDQLNLSARSATIAFSRVPELLQLVLNLFLNANGTLPNLLVPGITICTGILLLQVLLKKGNRNHILYLMIPVLQLGAVLIPHIISSDAWYAPRTLVGFFSFLSLLILTGYIYAPYISRYILGAATIIFLISNIIRINLISLDNFKLNALEQKTCVEIQAYIDTYESESGNKVTKVSCYNDTHCGYSERGVRYVWYDTNIRQLTVSWARLNMLNFYAGENYSALEPSNDIYNKYFKDKNWDYFTPDEQLVFDNDTLHWCLY